MLRLCAVAAFLLTACTASTTTEPVEPPEPQGQLLLDVALSTQTYEIHVYDFSTGRSNAIPIERDKVVGGRWRPDGGEILLEVLTDDASTVILADLDGSVRSVDAPWTKHLDYPDWGPDCETLVTRGSERTFEQDVWTANLDGGPPERIVESGGVISHPDWAANGDKITFSVRTRDREAPVQIWMVEPDGDNLELVAEADLGSGPASARLSPDGQQLAYVERSQIAVMDLGDGQIRQVTTERKASDPVWSPDGAWIAYVDGSLRPAIVRADGSETRRLGVRGFPTDWGPVNGSCPNTSS